MDRSRLDNLFMALGVPTRKSTRNAVNICCPFCSTRDVNFHLGVFLSSLRYHCWRCKARGSLRGLLARLGLVGVAAERAISGMPVRDERLGLSEQVLRALSRLPETPVGPDPRIVLPDSDPITADLLEGEPALNQFLTARGIPAQVAADYDCRWGGNSGDWVHRLIIPVYDDFGQLAAFQGRDVTGKARAKYLSEGRMAELLYWTDLDRDGDAPWRVYVVEGVFDAWRMGRNAVATFTHGISRSQRSQLLRHERIDEVVFAWDGDSYEMSVAAARSLAPLVRAGAVNLPPDSDPDELGAERMMELEVKWA